MCLTNSTIVKRLAAYIRLNNNGFILCRGKCQAQRFFFACLCLLRAAFGKGVAIFAVCAVSRAAFSARRLAYRRVSLVKPTQSGGPPGRVTAPADLEAIFARPMQFCLVIQMRRYSRSLRATVATVHTTPHNTSSRRTEASWSVPWFARDSRPVMLPPALLHCVNCGRRLR